MLSADYMKIPREVSARCFLEKDSGSGSLPSSNAGGKETLRYRSCVCEGIKDELQCPKDRAVMTVEL